MTAAADHHVILGIAAFPADRIAAAFAAAGVKVLDELPGRALLVAGPVEAVVSACTAFPGVRIVPERSFRLGE